MKKECADLIQEMNTASNADGSVSRKIKLPSKLEAVRIDKAVTGDVAPIKIEGTLTLAALMAERGDVLPTAEERAELDEYADE